MSHADWWFNVRPSNTEPLLRLNAEGRDRATMARVRDDVLARHQERPMSDTLDPALLEHHRLPRAATGPDRRGGEELVCGGCGLAYPVRDDIPVLLVDEAAQAGR